MRYHNQGLRFRFGESLQLGGVTILPLFAASPDPEVALPYPGPAADGLVRGDSRTPVAVVSRAGDGSGTVPRFEFGEVNVLILPQFIVSGFLRLFPPE